MTIHEVFASPEIIATEREREIFLGAALQKSRSWIHAHPETILSPDQLEALHSYLSRRATNEPVAYIIGKKEFYGRVFKTDSRALIPRPETESLIDLGVDFCIEHFKNHLKHTNKPCPVRILELGTGCGNIATTLALELDIKNIPAEIIATDISAEALELAQENWLHFGKSGHTRITFVEADLFDHPDIISKAPYDLIIANLPYVPNTWKVDPVAQQDVVFYEPDIALFGGEEGLDLYQQFFIAAPAFIEHGQILVEYHENFSAQMTQYAKVAFGKAQIIVHKDYAELDRALQLII